MTNFDRIIKEKIEKKNFSYRSSAWKNFCKKAGLRPGIYRLQIGLIITSTAIVGGITTFMIYHFSTKNPSPITTQTPTTNSSYMEEDILLFDSNQTLFPADTKTLVNIQEALPTQRRNSDKKIDAPAVQAPTPPAEETINDGKWKISIINPDTIKEN